MSQIGRISGPLLKDNLLRDGVDLAFKNEHSDTAILFLDVNNKRVGGNRENPAFDLDVNNFFLTTNAVIDQQLKIDNFKIEFPNIIETQIGGITIQPAGPDPITIIDSKLSTEKLFFDNNRIETVDNQNLIFNAGIKKINLNSSTNLDADLTVSGNTFLTGDITIKGNLQIGDEKPVDTITIVPDFTQDIIPGQDLTYDLGRTDLRWKTLAIPDTSGIDLINPFSVTVGGSIFIGGPNRIESLNINVLEINPQTGITFIEDIKIEENSITNLLDTPLTLKAIGIGYYKFAGDNALLIPAGDVSERPVTPEIGDTRWNTELGYLEVYNGTEYRPSVGEGEEVSQAEMEEISYLYSLILG